MREILEGDREDEAASEASVQAEGAGVGFALEQVRALRGGKRYAAADRFLAAQEALIAKQGHHLDEQILGTLVSTAGPSVCGSPCRA